jgi:hypothetical protein
MLTVAHPMHPRHRVAVLAATTVAAASVALTAGLSTSGLGGDDTRPAAVAVPVAPVVAGPDPAQSKTLQTLGPVRSGPAQDDPLLRKALLLPDR